MSGYVIRVEENCTHKQIWETASNYTRHLLTPGVYPIELVSIDYGPLREGEKPYYATAKIPSTIVEIYYEDRILNTTTSHSEKPYSEGTVFFCCYAYEIGDKIHAYNNAVIEKV